MEKEEVLGLIETYILREKFQLERAEAGQIEAEMIPRIRCRSERVINVLECLKSEIKGER